MKARIPYKMPKRQQKDLNRAIDKIIMERDSKYCVDMDASTLWTLHSEFGFGKDRLKKFWDACFATHQKLKKQYDVDGNEADWICTKLLKEIGIDVEEWYKEASKECETEKHVQSV